MLLYECCTLLALSFSEVVTGMLINRDDSLGSDVFNRIEIEFVLKSLGFIANEHPGYGPRYSVRMNLHNNFFRKLLHV